MAKVRLNINIKDWLLKSRRIVNNSCWLYSKGTLDKYSNVYYEGHNIASHVLAAKLWFDNYNPVLFVLHKCNNKGCWNPEHLYQGTRLDNAADVIKDGLNKNHNKTHCKHGHEFTAQNTHIDKKGSRHCKTCDKKRGTFGIHR